ncbi:hypothetical protein [Granulicella sp. S156]|jgi:hypothetical protein|uniref:hypothetical protein n=1 Tax=Granulicella sp. S156 TaxID=1747224 RepID=UPI00131DB40C|nr:hypothetical protein [Granulicella sp. S156]
MHFGRSIYCINPSHDVLLVISPIDALMTCGIVFGAVLIMFFFLLYQARAKVVIPVGLLLAVILAGAASNGTIELDAVRGTAVIHTVLFCYPQTYRYPLSSVMGASVAIGDQNDALRLVFQGGGDLQLTPYNQMGGKGQAAFAINQFLQEHGGRGSPY